MQLDDFRAAELRENDIEDGKDDAVWIGAKVGASLLTIGCEHGWIAEPGQRFKSELAESLMIFGDEDGLRATANGPGSSTFS